MKGEIKMTRKESQWLISILMSVVMIASLLASPMAVMADDNGGGEPNDPQKVVYVNSDGQKIDSKITEDGFVYSEVETEEYKGIEVYGYKGDAKVLKVPEQIDGKDVVSFAIDPRWPVWDEVYDQVESIELPKTIVTAHSKYMNYFNGLKSISIPAGNEYYKSVNGVLFKFDDEGCRVAAYPRAKEDKAFVMPEDMHRFYRFFTGCPVESVTLSKSISYVSPYYFYRLANLKEIKVAEGNEYYYSKDGVLFSVEEDYDWVYNEQSEEDEKVYFETRSLELYPWGKTASEYSVPTDIDRIGYAAFTTNPYLKKVVIPENITHIYSDAFELDTNLTEIEFKADKAPETRYFETRFQGMRHAMSEHEGKLQITYPAGATGYEDFIEWMKGKEFNYWDEEPYLDYEEVVLGSNRSPIWGYAEEGNKTSYTVYSKTENGTYSRNLPTEEGTWFAKLVVDATEEYTGLESEPFEFTVVALDETPAENYYIRVPGDIYVNVGEQFTVNGIPLFGKTDKVLFRSWDSREDENAWTEEVPTKAGKYDYKLIANGSETFEGAIFVASEDYYWIQIDHPERYIDLICDDILEGEKPEPRAEFSEGDEYADMDLSKVKFTFYQSVKKYVDEEDDWDGHDDTGYYVWELEEVKEPKELGEYKVVGTYDSEAFEIDCTTYFRICTKVELAANRINDLGSIKWLGYSDEEQVQKARAAFDALTPAEREELKKLGEENGIDYEQRLLKAEARVAADKADSALLEAQLNYDAVEAIYNDAKTKADASKAAADQAAATPGDAAVAAAQQAKTDADALEKAAADLEKAAQAVTDAAKIAADKAVNDPNKTRRDAQDAGRYIIVTEDIAKDATAKESDAKTAAKDAQTAVDTETRKAEEAAKDQAVKDAADAKAAADALDKALYTAESFQKVTDAVDALDLVLDRKDATSAEINAAVKSLNAAIAGLVKYETKQNPMKVKAKKPKVKLSKLKKKNQKVKKAKAFSVKKAKGKVTFKMAKYDKKAKKKIVISKKGDITVKKGLKKGKYTIKVKVTAAGKTEGNIKYKKLTKQVKVTVTVK